MSLPAKIFSKLLVLLALSGCQSKPIFTPSMAHQNFRSDLHIGEYMVSNSIHTIYTFSRGKGPEAGLVEVDLNKNTLRVLDKAASEGRDLMVDADKIFYRVDEKVFQLANGTITRIHSDVKKLHAAFDSKQGGIISFVSLINDQDAIICGSSIPKVFEIDERIRAVHRLPNNDFLLLMESSKNLNLMKFSCTSSATLLSVVEKNAKTAAAKFWSDKTELRLAYLQEEKGTLQLVKLKPETFEIMNHERVAGIDYESYQGMDIAFFEDGEEPGILFLNAENLKLVMARYKKSGWIQKQIPISGAVGFYNLILERKAQSIRAATHAFRSIDEKGEYHFEDLLIFEIPL